MALPLAACSPSVPGVPDYSDPQHAHQVGTTGAPPQIQMRITDSVELPGAARAGGLGWHSLSDGRDSGEAGSGEPAPGELLVNIAPDPATGAGGQLVAVDVADQSDPQVTLLGRIGYGPDYTALSQEIPQVQRAWAVTGLDDPDMVAISGGDRYGVLTELDEMDPAIPDSGGFEGVLTAAPGSPITPVTGACWAGYTDGGSAGVLTVDGSNTLTRRVGWPTGPGDGQGLTAHMLAGPAMAVRSEQQPQLETGPAAVPRLTPAPVVSVGGLGDLACVDAGSAQGLADLGAAVRPATGQAVAAVVDRDLADAWFSGGVELAAADAASGTDTQGLHATGDLVGSPTGAGEHRLDAVVLDTLTGTAVASLHLDTSGPVAQAAGLSDDLQVTGLELDPANPGTGWVTVAGSDLVFIVELD